jgi:hypothetical protein
MADTETVRDYRPVLTFNAAGSWTHGYRRTIAPVEMASAVSSAATTALAPSAY